MLSLNRLNVSFSLIALLAVLIIPADASNWKFREIIVADIPSHPAFVTDCSVVDINGDAMPDLWYSSRKGSRTDKDHFVSWYENTRDMSKWTRHLPFAGPACYGTWGDVDGDGDMDLIAGKDRRREALWMENPLLGGGKPGQVPWKIWPIERVGSKKLDPDEIYTFYRGADNRIHHGLDLNRDDRLDFVNCTYDGATHYVPGPTDPRTPDGGWKSYEIGGGRGTGSLGDLDGDGDIDLAASSGWYANPGDPTDAPWPHHEYKAGSYQPDGKVEIGDLNGDGRLDVAVSSEEGADGVVWYCNPGRGAKDAWKQNVVVPRNSGWEGMHTLQLTDFDGDGDLDVLTAEMHNRGKARVAVCENADGRGTSWNIHVISMVGTHNAKVADLDGDGDIDIAGKNFKDDQRPRIWINEMSPKMSLNKWRRHVISQDGAPMKGYHIFAADFDGDGIKDIATGDAWYRNPGAGWKRHGLDVDLGRIIAVSDFDGDTDILGGGFGWARNDGKGAFEVLTNISADGGFVQGAAVGSFKGGLDVIYTYKNGDHVRKLDVLAEPGSARWTDHLVYDWKGKSKDIDLGDIDRDGDEDIMFVGRDADAIQWLSNDGDGVFTPHDLAEAPSTIVHRCKLADIDGDGKLDVLTGSKGRMVHWFRQGDSAMDAWMPNLIAGPEQINHDPLSIDAADMDADGDLDVIVGEHSPPNPNDCRLLILENANGSGTSWSSHLVHKGDEHHQGAQTVDIDDDGDLDIISVGWTHKRVLLYENRSITRPRGTQGERVEIAVDVNSDLGELYNFWNVFPVTVQAPFLDETKHAELRRTYRYAKYINCVRLLGGIDLKKDDYFRGVDDRGEAICDFSEGIAMLRGIRKCGFTPWIVLDNVPAAMCDNPTKNRYGNTEPPKDFRVWASYVRQFVQTLVDEFGRREVSRWRFRVGTEPDLKPGHWSGTKEQYFAHYDHTIAAVLSVIPGADIGPGNIIDPVKKRKWQSWGTEIIDHCATGTNHATGRIGTPLNFFASSYYTAVGTTDERFDTLVGLLRGKLKQYPQFADRPVEIQEFGILSEGGKWIVGDGTEFGGSWMAHFADKIYDLNVRRVYQWWWNTNKGGEIPIPLNHVLDMLEAMVGGTRLKVEASGSSEADHIGCIAAAKEGDIDLIVFRHLAVRDNGQPVAVRVTLKGNAATDNNRTIMRAAIIDGAHAGFMHERKADMDLARAEAGENANPYAVAFKVMTANRAKYERMSVLSDMDPPALTVDPSGSVRFDLELDGHSVIHLRLQPK